MQWGDFLISEITKDDFPVLGGTGGGRAAVCRAPHFLGIRIQKIPRGRGVLPATVPSTAVGRMPRVDDKRRAKEGGNHY